MATPTKLQCRNRLEDRQTIRHRVCIYKYKRRSKEKRQSWIGVEIHGGSHESFEKRSRILFSASPLEVDRINISSWKRLIGPNVDWKVKKWTHERYLVWTFAFHSGFCWNFILVLRGRSMEISVCVGYSWLV